MYSNDLFYPILFQMVEYFFCIRLLNYAAFCDDGFDVSAGGDVEGGIIDVGVRRGDALGADVGDFVGGALFDGDV